MNPPPAARFSFLPRRTILFTLLALILLPGLLAHAQPPDKILATFAIDDAQTRSQLIADGYELWGATLDSLTLVVDARELRTLSAQGFKVIRNEPLAFPPDFDAYHDYAEMLVDLQDLAQRFPDIVRLQSVGQSLEGREIWALRITDQPDAIEPDERSILIYAGTHAREHLTVEQALYLAHDLVENYGKEGEPTNLVSQRDIWLIPNLNPDGSEYDINQWSSQPRYWRKNRRNNGNGTWGVDLNRNFGYRWGHDNTGSSPNSSSETYRGPSAFSEPESRVLRDFVIAHPTLTMAISLHTYGELVLYPYGYTYQDQPADMQADDLAIFRAIARGIADRNGYTAQQASDLYLTNGDHTDWLYGARGIYGFTMEMYPTSSNPGFYPNDDVIPAQTARNRSALRYAIAQADDPDKSVGKGADMTPPTIQIVTLVNGDVFIEQQPISVTVSANDNVGVTTVAYLVDGQPIAVRTAPDFDAVLTLAPGQYELRVRAFDAAHWNTLSDPVALTIQPDPNATATPEPPACTELIKNGGFETDAAWTFTSTASTARYSAAKVRSGERSARFGLLPTTALDALAAPETDLGGAFVPAAVTYSTGYQSLSLPANAENITLRFWRSLGTQDNNGDWQRVLLLKPDNAVIATLWKTLGDDDSWKEITADLTPYAGRNVKLYFEVYNDDTGDGNRTWMYIDDVSVQVCDPSSATPTPTVTPTVVFTDALYLPVLLASP